MHVAFVTPEMAPFIKTGGLADVSSSLPKALARLGHRVTVLLPRYGGAQVPSSSAAAGRARIPLDGAVRTAAYRRAGLGDGLEVVFVDHPPFFDRPHPYGTGNQDYDDNALRFAFFARAALEYFRGRGERPDVFHAHDWQAGLLPVYLKALYASDPLLSRSPTVFTIHNLAYQGNFAPDTLGRVGLPAHLMGIEALEFHGQVSYLKGGILFSEAVSTVSPQYAREIQRPELGSGFDGILRSRAADLHGILNGVDYDEWDPRRDPYIARHYTPETPAGKAECKRDLVSTFGLRRTPDLPVVGAVSRLVPQKGFDLVVDVGLDLLARPLRLVAVGTGDPAVQDGLAALAERAPGRVGVRFTYDEALAHKIVAGSDLFLMPSRFEPCGLTQMYSLRYGTVPVVRATGGLADTVEPYDPEADAGTGFRFESEDAAGLLAALDQALLAYRDRRAWRRLMRRGMERDFSWEHSARRYVELYGHAASRA